LQLPPGNRSAYILVNESKATQTGAMSAAVLSVGISGLQQMEIVHLSDLHLKKANPFQRDLIQALISDLERERSGGLSPDFLLFSGDLVHNPDDADIYSTFEQDVMTPLLRVLELAPDRVILCPGNHDVSQKRMSQHKLMYDALHAPGLDQKYLVQHRRSEDFRSYCRHISEGFFSTSNRFGKEWDDPLSVLYDFPEANVSFLGLNSAFLCSLEGSREDRGKLAFPVDHLLERFQEIPSGRVVVSVAHHPLSDFNEETCRRLIPILEKRSVLHCFGHVHQPKPSTISSSTGNYFCVQGGALYETDEYYNGYAIIRTNDNGQHISAQYRTYYVDRQEFDVGTNVAKDGIFYNTDEARIFFVVIERSLIIAPCTTCLYKAAI
jgi:calcineurin-like phosphoesterase family protein